MSPALIVHVPLLNEGHGFGSNPRIDGRIARNEARPSARLNETAPDAARRNRLSGMILNRVRPGGIRMKREVELMSRFVQPAVMALDVASRGHVRKSRASDRALVNHPQPTASGRDLPSGCGGWPLEGRASDPRVAPVRVDRRRASRTMRLVTGPNGQGPGSER